LFLLCLLGVGASVVVFVVCVCYVLGCVVLLWCACACAWCSYVPPDCVGFVVVTVLFVVCGCCFSQLAGSSFSFYFAAPVRPALCLLSLLCLAPLVSDDLQYGVPLTGFVLQVFSVLFVLGGFCC
jgi:hypothetical protein